MHSKIVPLAILLTIALTVSSATFALQGMVWIGAGITLDATAHGLRIISLPYGSPAEKAGVLIDDIIVGLDGHDFTAEPAALDGQFRTAIMQHKAGDTITLRIVRNGAGQSPMDIPVAVENRPVATGAVKAYSISKVNWPEEELARALVDRFKIGDAYADLRQRLARLSTTGDPFRLSRAAYIQREPFQLRTVAGETFDRLATAMNSRNPSGVLQLATEWLDAAPARTPSLQPLKTGLNLEQHLDQLVNLLKEAGNKRNEAFSKLTAQDQKFLEDNCDELFDQFSHDIDLQADRDRERRRRNARVLELAGRVDFARLFEGAALLARVTQDSYLNDLEGAVRKAWETAGKPAGMFVNRDSQVGKIQVGGAGSTWYTEDAAIILDLGGDDFYTNNAGSPRGNAMPAALLIDFAGNDAYESTTNWTQGAALMGYGMLIDRSGNDEYIGQEWTQGAAVLGVALFLDESGNDIYRARQYAQGAAAWGIGLHVDYEGDDTYDARLFAQGVAMPGGAGWLLNGKGNDNYYSKGERPTAYGDSGIFDSWSQGCAVGFRELQSGGIGLLYDGGGKDRYEAGNFSQGGGYYFGVGLLRDAGNENDTYIGSRYGQGFAAHEAIGYFEEMGGNDFYTTRHAVAQGISWDESVTAFIDHGGDDVYEGGASFSQGASSHNGFSLFLDLGGRNRFVYGTPQGSAGPNDYHGGTSFSLFVAANDKGNTYTSAMKPASIQLNGENGLFVDVTGSIESAVKKSRVQIDR
jgi:hypothetical protein